MSRNTEKAQSMLYRFQEQQASELGLVSTGNTRRPRDINSVESLPLCQKWRSQVVRDISRKLSKIEDTALSDFEIRDLNDEINKLMKEKYVWELRIKHLGGPSYRGQWNSGGSYQYFGRAKELPDVQEFYAFEAEKKRKKDLEARIRSQRGTIKSYSAEYYGFTTDSALLEQEREFSKSTNNSTIKIDETAPKLPEVPSISEIEALLVERKKRQLQNLYL